MISYYKYYIEIKNRCILLLFTWTFSLIVCYFYKEIILFVLMDSNISTMNLNEKPYFIFTNVTEVFYVYLDLSLFLANQTVILILCYEILMFLSLGLYQFEFIKLKSAFKIFVVSWLLSIILLYKFIIPFSWNFFLSFQENSNTLQPVLFLFEAKLIEYFHYMTNLYYICLVNCQFFSLLVIFLTNLNEKLNKTKTFRKLFYLIFVVFSTIVTPPDIISQICIYLFLVVVYEFLILLKRIKVSMATN